MPELPEVETTLRGIAPHVLGKCVVSVLVRESRLRWPVSPDLPQKLCKSTIRELRRRAKYLQLITDSGVLMIHLGMSGSLRLVDYNQVPRKHDHIDIIFEDDLVLRFSDSRRFGSFLWLELEEIDTHRLLADLGVEPLVAGFDGDYLYRIACKRSLPVKNFIMDQRVVVGVGNIYANEALFRAGIRPSRSAGRVSRQRYSKLAEAIKGVLQAAIQQGGTTLRDFTQGNGEPGYFRQSLQVYGRAGRACAVCDLPLSQIRIGGRGSVYCRSCQT